MHVHYTLDGYPQMLESMCAQCLNDSSNAVPTIIHKDVLLPCQEMDCCVRH